MVDFIRHRTQNHDLTRLQDRIEDFAQDIQKQGIINGQLIKGVKVNTSGSTRVQHSLGRKYSGYVIVDRDEFANIKTVASDNGSPAKFIPLVASATVTISLWVF